MRFCGCSLVSSRCTHSAPTGKAHMTGTLHDRVIRAAVKQKQNAEFRDEATPGLRLRVFAKSGKATWSYRYRPRGGGGGYKRVTVGQFPGTLLSEARAKAARIRARVIDGADPAAELAAKRKAETVAELCTAFLADEIKPKKKAATYSLYEVYARKHVSPAIGEKKAHTVTRADIAWLHRDIGKQEKKKSGGGKKGDGKSGVDISFWGLSLCGPEWNRSRWV